MSFPVESQTIKVPGASLYYEATGQGPLLLIIPGGPQDAGLFADMAQRLAHRYRVVAYDPRGNSRSTFDGEEQPLDLDVLGDDAAHLIASLGNGPAHVFGTSGGAQIGLNLAARHPVRVATLVAHEPPTVMLLDDPSEALAGNRSIVETFHRDGVEAAMGLFFSMNGLDMDGPPDAPPPEEMPPEAVEAFARISANFPYWLAHGIEALSLYKPETEVLASGRPRVVVALGERSQGQPIYAMGSALASRLGIEPTPFPGDHVGYETDPEAFVAALERQLAP
ncbi:alpha/beta hydrolase [Devosia sp. H5989]|nr:alpha/beta hydrolase [Devosia sp. H5989]